MVHEWAPCELKAWGQGRQCLTATKGLSVIMLSTNLSLCLSLLYSPKALRLITIHISLMVAVCAQELFFFYWKHKISQILVTLTPQLYIKIRRKFYLKKDLNKRSVKGQIYSLPLSTLPIINCNLEISGSFIYSTNIYSVPIIRQVPC